MKSSNSKQPSATTNTSLMEEEEHQEKPDSHSQSNKSKEVVLASTKASNGKNVDSHTKLKDMFNKHLREQDSILKLLQENTQARKLIAENAYKMIDKYKLKEQSALAQAKELANLKGFKQNSKQNIYKTPDPLEDYNFKRKDTQIKATNFKYKLVPLSHKTTDITQWGSQVSSDELKDTETIKVHAAIIKQSSFFESNLIEYSTDSVPKAQAKMEGTRRIKGVGSLDAPLVLSTSSVQENEVSLVSEKSIDHSQRNKDLSIKMGGSLGKENSLKPKEPERKFKQRLPSLEPRKSVAAAGTKEKSADPQSNPKSREKTVAFGLTTNKGFLNIKPGKKDAKKSNLNSSFDANGATHSKRKRARHDHNLSFNGETEHEKKLEEESHLPVHSMSKQRIRIIEEIIKPGNIVLPQDHKATQVQSEEEENNNDTQENKKTNGNVKRVEEQEKEPGGLKNTFSFGKFNEDLAENKIFSVKSNDKDIPDVITSHYCGPNSNNPRFLIQQSHLFHSYIKNLSSHKEESPTFRGFPSQVDSGNNIPTQIHFGRTAAESFRVNNHHHVPFFSHQKSRGSMDVLNQSDCGDVHNKSYDTATKKELSLKRWEKVGQASYKIYDYSGGKGQSPTFDNIKGNPKWQKVPRGSVKVLEHARTEAI